MSQCLGYPLEKFYFCASSFGRMSFIAMMQNRLTTAKKKMAGAWLMCFLLLWLLGMKGTHFHAATDACQHTEHPTSPTESHDSASDQCAICLFMLSPFLPTVLPDLPLVIPVEESLWVACAMPVLPQSVLTTGSRAPPAQG